MIMSLVCLKKVMEKAGGGVKPCDYFDMIAGSEAGGYIAIYLNGAVLLIHFILYSG